MDLSAEGSVKFDPNCFVTAQTWLDVGHHWTKGLSSYKNMHLWLFPDIIWTKLINRSSPNLIHFDCFEICVCLQDVFKSHINTEQIILDCCFPGSGLCSGPSICVLPSSCCVSWASGLWWRRRKLSSRPAQPDCSTGSSCLWSAVDRTDRNMTSTNQITVLTGNYTRMLMHHHL